jgi:glycosyltransferase involved in cell wall biosynthesis
VLVAGERSARLASWLGFEQSRIHTGAYGFDYRLFSTASAWRRERHPGWPQSFVYVGRYVERKGLDTLVAAYRLYRREVAEPWRLVCCGQGPLASLLATQPGVEDRGFVQPDELPGLLADMGAFILPSRFEAWGVALAEAGAAGLPLIASRAVGAAPELLRDRFNGRLFDSGDPDSLAECMLWLHNTGPACAELGSRSQMLAEPFRAELWAARVTHQLSSLLEAAQFDE